MITTRAPRAVQGEGVASLLAEARSTLLRLRPPAAARAHREGGLLVDIRPQQQRLQEGAIPGAVLIERNVLEWRLEPDGRWRTPELVDYRQVVVVFCSAGYASSLAAAALQSVGLVHATDMIGGFVAWRRSGLPVISATARVRRRVASHQSRDGLAGFAAPARPSQSVIHSEVTP